MLKKQKEYIKQGAVSFESVRKPEVRFGTISNFRKFTLKFTENMDLPGDFTQLVE